MVDLYSEQLVSCEVASSFIESVSSHITSTDDLCTLLNVPLNKVAVDSSSSGYLKAVRVFQEWQTQSEGTYQCLRQQMDKFSIFSGRNILVCSHLLSQSLVLLFSVMTGGGQDPSRLYTTTISCPFTYLSGRSVALLDHDL